MIRVGVTVEAARASRVLALSLIVAGVCSALPSPDVCSDPALQLVHSGELRAAAAAWVDAARQTTRRTTQREHWRRAWLLAMAAHVLEEEGDRATFAAWMQSQSLLAQLGADWDQERLRLSDLSSDDDAVLHCAQWLGMANWQGPQPHGGPTRFEADLEVGLDPLEKLSAIDWRSRLRAVTSRAEATSADADPVSEALPMEGPEGLSAAGSPLDRGPHERSAEAEAVSETAVDGATAGADEVADLPARATGPAVSSSGSEIDSLHPNEDSNALRALRRSATGSAGGSEGVAPALTVGRSAAAEEDPSSPYDLPLVPAVVLDQWDLRPSGRAFPTRVREEVGTFLSRPRRAAWLQADLLVEEAALEVRVRPSRPRPWRQMVPATAAGVSADLLGEELMSLRSEAAVAWRYFERNLVEQTGLVQSVDGYPMLTLWDLGSTLAGFVSARELEIIGQESFDSWWRSLVGTLEALPLYRDELPNREYDARRGAMAASGDLPGTGSGWSALDIGRLLVWLRIVADWYPECAADAERIVQRWSFDRVVGAGGLAGTIVSGSSPERLRQEGRLGYEQYAAAGYLAWGIDVPAARDYEQTRNQELLGHSLLVDERGLAFLTSDPFLLGIMELGGVDHRFTEQAAQMFAVQEERWRRTGLWTAVNEDSLDRSPWFAYSSVWYDGRPFETTSHRGRRLEDARTLSTKAAFGWWAVYPDDAYAGALKAQAAELHDSERGFLAGRYEDGAANRSFNVNTAGIVLEALLYRARLGAPFLGSPSTASGDAVRAPGSSIDSEVESLGRRTP